MSSKKPHRTCEICGAKERHLESPRFFANFPSDEARCRKWIQVTGNEDLVHVPIEILNKRRHICGEHFKKTHINKTNTKLKKRAVPSINLRSAPLSDDQMSEFPLHVWKKPDMLEQPPGCQDIEKCLDFLEDYTLTTYQSRCINYQKIQSSVYEQLQINESVARRLLEVCIHDLNEDMKYASIVLAIIAQVSKKIKGEQCPMVPELVQSGMAVLHILKTTSMISKMQALQRQSFETFLTYPDETYIALATKHGSEVIELFNLYLHQGIPVFLRIMVFQTINLFLNTLPPEKKSEFVRLGLNVWLGKVMPATMTLLVSSQSPDVSITLDVWDILTIELERIDYSENPHWVLIMNCICTPQKYPTIMKSMLDSGDERWHRVWILLVKLLKQQITVIQPNLGSPINPMLPVVEAAFKVDVVHRCHAFKCWSVLIDNFSAETNENLVKKRIKLLVIPLRSNNAKVVETAMAKFDTWWHMIRVFESRLHSHFDMVFIPFLQFCFGNPKQAVDALVPGQLSLLLKKKTVQAFVESTGHIDYTGCIPDEFPRLAQRVLVPKVLQDSLAQWVLSLKMAIKICGSAEYNIDDGKKQMSCIWNSFLFVISRLQVDAKKDVMKNLMDMVTALVQECRNEKGVLDIVFDVVLKQFLKDPQTRSMLDTVRESQTNFSGFTRQILDLITSPIFANYYSNDPESAVSKLTQFTNAILDDVLGPPSASLELMLQELPANSNGPLLWTALMASVRQIREELNGDVLKKILMWPLDHIDLFTNAKYAALAWNESYNILRSKVKGTTMQKDVATILIKSNSALCDLSMFALLHVIRNNYDREYETNLNIDLPKLTLLVEKRHFLDCDCKTEIYRSLVDSSALMLSTVGEVMDSTVAESALTLANNSLKMLVQNEVIHGNDGCIIHAQKLLVQLKRILNIEEHVRNEQLIENLMAANNVVQKQSVKCLLTDILKSFLSKSAYRQSSLHSKVVESIRPKQDFTMSSKTNDTPKIKDKFVAPDTTTKKKKGEASIVKTVVENGEEYVVVKSNWKFNPKKLTENQKEKFQKKREDIPALYQDLSQSQDEFKLRSWKTDSQDTSMTSSNTTNSGSKAGNSDAAVILKKMPSTEMVPKIMESIFSDKGDCDGKKQAANENVNSDAESPDTPNPKILSLPVVKPKSPRVALKDRVYQNVKILLDKSKPDVGNGAVKVLNQTVTETVPKTPVSKPLNDPAVVFSGLRKISSERPSRAKRKPRKYGTDFTEVPLTRRKSSVIVNDSQYSEEMSENSKCSEASKEGKPKCANVNSAIEPKQTVKTLQRTLDPEKTSISVNVTVDPDATHCDLIASKETIENESPKNTKSPNIDTLKPVVVLDGCINLSPKKITSVSPKKDILIEGDSLIQSDMSSKAPNMESKTFIKKPRKSRIEKEVAIDMVGRKESCDFIVSKESIENKIPEVTKPPNLDTLIPVVVLDGCMNLSPRKIPSVSPKKEVSIEDESFSQSDMSSKSPNMESKTFNKKPRKSRIEKELAIDMVDRMVWLKESRINEVTKSSNSDNFKPVVSLDVCNVLSPEKEKQDRPKRNVITLEKPPLSHMDKSTEARTKKSKEGLNIFTNKLRTSIEENDLAIGVIDSKESHSILLKIPSDCDTSKPVVVLENCKVLSLKKNKQDSPKQDVITQEEPPLSHLNMSTEVRTNKTESVTKKPSKSSMKKDLNLQIVDEKGRPSAEPKDPSPCDISQPVVILDDCNTMSPLKTNQGIPKKNQTEEEVPLSQVDMLSEVLSNKAKENPKTFTKKPRKSRIESELAIDMVEKHSLLTVQPEKRTRKSVVGVVCTRRKTLGEKINQLPKSNSKLEIKRQKKRDIQKNRANDVVKDLFSAKHSQEDSSFSSNEIMSEDFIESSQDSTLTTISINSGKKTPKAVLNNIQGLVKRRKILTETPNIADKNNIQGLVKRRKKDSETQSIADISTDMLSISPENEDIEFSRNKSVDHDNTNQTVNLTADFDTEPMDDKIPGSDDVVVISDEPVISIEKVCIISTQSQDTADADTQPNDSKFLSEMNKRAHELQPADVNTPNSERLDPFVIVSSNMPMAGLDVISLATQDVNESGLSSPFKDDEQRNKDFLNNTLEISPIKSRSPIQDDNKPQSPETSKDYVIVKLSSPVQCDGEPFEKSSSPEIFTEDRVSPDKRDLSPPREEVVVNASSPNSSLSLKKNKPQMRQGGRAAQMLGLCVPERQNSINIATENGVEPEESKKPSLTPARRNLRILYNFEPSDNNSEENEDNESFLKFKKTLPTADCSPAGPILKRKLIDIADDATVSPASKRKRVSFHDPPVSTTMSVHKYIEPLGIRSPQSSLTKKQERLLRNTSMRSPKKLENIFKLDTALTKTVESFIDPNSSVQSEDITMSSLDQTPSIEIVKASELNDADPICPELINCTDAISIIAAELSSPAMKSLFIKEIKGNIQTIGDLARLTELEVNRLCLKAPKVKTAKRVLSEYAAKHTIVKEVEQPIETEATVISEMIEVMPSVDMEVQISEMVEVIPGIDTEVQTDDIEATPGIDMEVQTDEVEVNPGVDIDVQTDQASLKESEMQTDAHSVASVLTQTGKTKTRGFMVQTNETTAKDMIAECSKKPDFIKELRNQLDQASKIQVIHDLPLAVINDVLRKKLTSPADSSMIIDTVLKNQEVFDKSGDSFLHNYLLKRYGADSDFIEFCRELFIKRKNNTT